MKEENDYISLKDIICQLQKFWKHLVNKWRTVTTITVVFSFLFILFAYLSPTKYEGKLVFVLSTEQSSKTSLSALAGQFGLSGIDQSEGAFSGENIVELLKSKKMVKRAMFRALPNGELLVNHYVQTNKLNKSWEKNERTKNAFPFPKNKNLSPVQDSLFREIHLQVTEKHLSIGKTQKKLSFYHVSVSTSNETTAVYLPRFLVEETAQYYIETKTKIARDNLNMLQHEADSLSNLLSGVITSTAEKVDQTFNLNPSLQKQRSGVQKNQVRVSVLGTAYGEVVKNLELAKITLQKETPLYQLIDAPELPLKAQRKSKLLFGLLGAILGGFVAIAYTAFNLYYTENLKYYLKAA